MWCLRQTSKWLFCAASIGFVHATAQQKNHPWLFAQHSIILTPFCTAGWIRTPLGLARAKEWQGPCHSSTCGVCLAALFQVWQLTHSQHWFLDNPPTLLTPEQHQSSCLLACVTVSSRESCTCKTLCFWSIPQNGRSHNLETTMIISSFHRPASSILNGRSTEWLLNPMTAFYLFVHFVLKNETPLEKPWWQWKMCSQGFWTVSGERATHFDLTEIAFSAHFLKPVAPQQLVHEQTKLLPADFVANAATSLIVMHL